MQQTRLQTQLTLSSLLLVVIFSGFFALYFPWQQEKLALDGLESHAMGYSKVLAGIVGPVLEGSEVGGVQIESDITQWVMADERILYIAIVKPGGRPFAEHVRAGATIAPIRHYVTAPLSKKEAGFLHAAVPVTNEHGEVVGSVNIGLSQKTVAMAKETSQRTSLLVGLVILIVGILLSLVVGRSIASPVLKASVRVDKVSKDIAYATRSQEASSAQEAAAVAETRRSMELLYDSARQIAEQSSEVLGNAERSAAGSTGVADRVGDLNTLSERIAEILGTIMTVADKADLLALNASLEGTKAGEAGKGFTLVAAEMRRLAETIMESVKGIRELMREMREAAQKAVFASEDGTRSSTATTQSARKIALLTQEQRQATEQVMSSMAEMADILQRNLDSVQQLGLSADGLADLSRTLSSLVDPGSNQATTPVHSDG